MEAEKPQTMMSENVPKMRQKARLEYIEANILFKTQQEIADECQVNRKTIQRDIEKWKAKGGFDRFLMKEFFELYGKEKLRNVSRALDRIVFLLSRTTTQDTTIKRYNVKWLLDLEPNNNDQIPPSSDSTGISPQ